MSTTTLIAVVGILVAIAALAVSIWVAAMARTNLTLANYANAIQDAIRDLASRDLTLTAYANAIQGGILDLKRSFAERPDIFHEQMEMNPEIRKLIPEYMQGKENIPKFLAFAGGMWRLSYVYSVMVRGSQLGLTESECKGLNNEMKLWLIHVPGFYHVYESQVSELKVHNPDFLEYLEKVYSSEEFRKAFERRAGYDPKSPRRKPDSNGDASERPSARVPLQRPSNRRHPIS
jgi:hypothetical protein